jgi:hypothetical protein
MEQIKRTDCFSEVGWTEVEVFASGFDGAVPQPPGLFNSKKNLYFQDVCSN